VPTTGDRIAQSGTSFDPPPLPRQIKYFFTTLNLPNQVDCREFVDLQIATTGTHNRRPSDGDSFHARGIPYKSRAAILG